MVTQVLDEISAELSATISKQAEESNKKIFFKELVKSSSVSRPIAKLRKA